MKKSFKKYKNQKGYAILFTMVIVSAISVITAGLSNAAYKQLLLSSLARDSQAAFYQADTAGDCALYADRVEFAKFSYDPEITPNIFHTPSDPWSCGELSLKIEDSNDDFSDGYQLNPPDPESDDPCFRIDVKKTTIGTGTIDDPFLTDTMISARGYNICDKGDSRTVEREIEIDYIE